MTEQDEVDGFDIGDDQYAVPSVWTFDMDEAEILWGYCQVAVEDLLPDEDGLWSGERNAEVELIIKNPSFRKTLMHVAYRRGNPDATKADIQKQIGKASNAQSLAAWLEKTTGSDSSPPAQESTSKPDAASSSEKVDSSTNSGSASSNDSGRQDAHPEPIGAGR